jgi:NAD+ kinase
MPDVNIRTIGVIAKPRSDRATTLVPELVEWLRRRSFEVVLDEEGARYAQTTGHSRDEVAKAAQLLIVLGGDGTLLSAARAAIAQAPPGQAIPLFAANLGGLGFLTAIKVDDIFVQLEQVFRGEFIRARRRMLHCEVWRDGRKIVEHQALNDVVLTKADIARMIDLEIHVDRNFVCVYKADGLIISTPTGSTAYSLSAGGPIMTPNVEAFAITPICPHMLTNRPVIVPDESEIHVSVRGSDATQLTIDGQVGESLAPGDRVVCRHSEYSIHLLQPPATSFFDVLREKLKWGDR